MAEPNHENKQPDDERGAEWIALGIAIGVGLGSAFGVILDNIALGIAIGIGTGVAIGSGLMAMKQNGQDDSSGE